MLGLKEPLNHRWLEAFAVGSNMYSALPCLSVASLLDADGNGMLVKMNFFYDMM